MTDSGGVFPSLRSPNDLLRKLKHDFDRLSRNRVDQYAAFDFFVTAWHIVDWLFPGDSKKAKEARDQLRNQHCLLQIADHIASGAKHFAELRSRHVSVAGTTHKIISAAPGTFAPGTVAPGGVREELYVKLKEDATREFGDSIEVYDLAKKMLDFWEQYFSASSATRQGQ
jgi:hypothetical protein